eukprot:CAMPEP_0176480076 /NCGR_PEP_ID=MMETSP0200_2-20121128/2084_1 /TAXON_ID=947934 /ORGANISM="Chaetoceros sp., Strain GSL56" /LENGTH=113 /DNA_ID=CAMNT_0017876171 /DNA_START=16 /DNA_END=357 /DNA_ORIENTATION=-
MGLPDRASFQPDAELAAKIEAQSNPMDPNQHNEGQPIRQNLDSAGHQRSKFMTDCSKEHRNSLQCIEDNYDKRETCQPFFDAYKKCRKDEHDRKMEENARLSGKNDGDGCVIS